MIPLIALIVALTTTGPISWIAWGYVAVCAIGGWYWFMDGYYGRR